jgi:hypothetical protein
VNGDNIKPKISDKRFKIIYLKEAYNKEYMTRTKSAPTSLLGLFIGTRNILERRGNLPFPNVL